MTTPATPAEPPTGTPAQPRYRTQTPVFEELVGRRILLRPFRTEDAPALFAAIDESREHLRPFILWDHYHQTVDDTADYIREARARWMLREELPVGIFERATGRLLGGTGLMFPRDAWSVRACEIGYWLRASAAGQGYMTEAVRLLTEWAFTQWGANRVEIGCDARNVRSAAVPQRLGFILEGWLRNAHPGEDGMPRDSLIFALTRHDFARDALRTLPEETSA